jgi:hypothetical protein
MRAIDQPVQIATPPPRYELDADLESARDRTDRPDPDLLDLAVLDARDRRIRDPGSGGDIGLTPSVGLPDAPHGSAKAGIQHASIVARDAYLPAIAAWRCG